MKLTSDDVVKAHVHFLCSHCALVCSVLLLVLKLHKSFVTNKESSVNKYLICIHHHLHRFGLDENGVIFEPMFQM
jgi:hypothetical protein